ncbi:MAG: chromosomal replication initiator protein [Acidimicrobiaceae bacterium]|nr:chromosomal replication initiator protein [Acidimicrobiaceae bacterium]
MDTDVLWKVCAEALRAQVAESTWHTSFEQMVPVQIDETSVTLAVPSALVRERIESRYLSLVQTVVADTMGTSVTVHLVVDPSARPLYEDPASLGQASAVEPAVEARAASPARGRPSSLTVGNEAEDLINPHYTFEAFVIGDSNRFAHAASLSVAETPARSYNPLFIQGDSGLGKTHLLHAIGNYVRENFPGRHVRYVSTETFLNEFVDAIRTNNTSGFKRRYRECDVLLVDDIQFIENKERLQEEFFHTFNHLHGASKQIVITSDRPPRSIATLEDRLRSRFLSGLVADVQPPELETRLAILRKKAEGERTAVPGDVLNFIATNVTTNIRELEGALIRVTAYASLNKQPLTRETAEFVLSDILASNAPRQITPQVILHATSETFGFSIEELCGTNRRRPLVTARQIGMYVFREVTDFSYPAIAREFGGRDHTTVIHAVEKITGLMKERRQIYDQVTTLIQRVRSGG